MINKALILGGIHIGISIISTILVVFIAEKEEVVISKEKEVELAVEGSSIKDEKNLVREVLFTTLIPIMGTVIGLGLIYFYRGALKELKEREDKAEKLESGMRIAREFKEIEHIFYKYKESFNGCFEKELNDIVHNLDILSNLNYRLDLVKESSRILIELLDISNKKGVISEEVKVTLKDNLIEYNLFLLDLLKVSKEDTKKDIQKLQNSVIASNKNFNNFIKGMRKDLEGKKGVF